MHPAFADVARARRQRLRGDGARDRRPRRRRSRRPRCSPAICMSCPIFSATARPSPTLPRAARSSGSTCATTRRARCALYVAGAVRPGAGPRRRSSARSRRGGFAFDTLVVSGGAARSALVRQIIADATGKRVARARDERAGAARRGDARRGRRGAARHAIGDDGDVAARPTSASPAGGEIAALPRPQAARLRSAAGGRAPAARRRCATRAEAPPAVWPKARHLRLRRRARRQRDDRAGAHARGVRRRSGSSSAHERGARSFPRRQRPVDPQRMARARSRPRRCRRISATI